MKCRRCNVRESTGLYIELCDPCFDEFEASIKARKTPGAQVQISDSEVEFFADSVVDRIKS